MDDEGGLCHGWQRKKGAKYTSKRERCCPYGEKILSVCQKMDHVLSLRKQHQRLRFHSVVLEEGLLHQFGKCRFCGRCFEPMLTVFVPPQVTAQSPTKEVPLEPSEVASPRSFDGSSLPSAAEDDWPSPQAASGEEESVRQIALAFVVVTGAGQQPLITGKEQQVVMGKDSSLKRSHRQMCRSLTTADAPRRSRRTADVLLLMAVRLPAVFVAVFTCQTGRRRPCSPQFAVACATTRIDRR